MRAGPPAICAGTVTHVRRSPRRHAFTRPVSYAWFDPDRPDELCRPSRLWSTERFAPVRFVRPDYGGATTGSLAAEVRDELAPLLGRAPVGEIRMLTQLRRWGWLFNPITVFIAWDTDPDAPVGVVLEVTNTPWKERHRYPLRLTTDTAGESGGDTTGKSPGADHYIATTRKVLHVSPFLDEDSRYLISLFAGGPRHEDSIRFIIDVVHDDAEPPIVHTELRVRRQAATRRALRQAVTRQPLATHMVSAAIHSHAARLALKRTPFVAHPSKREAP